MSKLLQRYCPYHDEDRADGAYVKYEDVVATLEEMEKMKEYIRHLEATYLDEDF